MTADANVLRPRVGMGWADQARAKIHQLEAGGRLAIRPVGVPLQPFGCFDADKLDLVRLVFDFEDRELLTVVRIQRIAGVGLLRALRDVPRGIVVGYGGTGSTASYRDCPLQAELYAKWLAGSGGRAVPAGQSGHNRGLSIDAPTTPEGHDALGAHGFEFIGPADPSHATYGIAA